MIVGDNTWQIVEHFEEVDQERLLNSLVQGTNALSFRLDAAISQSTKLTLLEGIDTSIIKLYLDGNAEGIISILDEEINATVPYRFYTELSTTPANLTYTVFEFTGKNFQKEAQQYLENLSKITNLAVNVTYHISNDYLRTVVELRVIKLLWKHLEKSNLLKNCTLHILAQTSAYPEETSVEEDLIFASTHLMSAVIGSADAVMIQASPKEGHSAEFKQRISRNLHHLLVYESGMDKIKDPLKGSYFIENETLRIAEEIWNKFIE